MPLRPHLQFVVIAAWLLLAAVDGSGPLDAALDESPPDMEAASQLPHGSTEVLVETLIRVREMEGLLAASDPGRDGQLSDTALEALSQIFAHLGDAFEIDMKTGIPRSIRGQAMSLLRDASPSVQQAWMNGVTPVADVRLKEAMASANSELLRSVAMQFPMTESGIDATVLLLTRDFLRYGSVAVRMDADHLRQSYRGTVLEEFTDRRLNRLPQLLHPAAVEVQQSGAVRLSVTTSADAVPIAPPSPKPLWEWHESIWNYPDAPQPEAGMTLESWEPGVVGNVPEFSNWRPIFWGGSLLLRTPFRLIAFDRLTGHEQWSLPTQTFVPHADDADSDSHELNIGYRERTPRPSSVGGLAAFGLMSADHEFLYFIDQFDFFRSEASYRRYRTRPIVGFPDLEDYPHLAATRLVALRRSGVGGMPVVAWIAGDAGTFQYELLPEGTVLPPGVSARFEPKSEDSDVENDSGRESVVSTTHNAAPVVPEGKLDGHRFVAPPVGGDTRLFVLSAGKEQFWLNSLDRGTGRVVWQQPLTFIEDTLSQYVEPWNQAAETSVCLLCGDTVVCALANGVVVGVSSADGQLRWATAIRDQTVAPPSRGFGLPMLYEPDRVDTTAAFIPVASDGVIVCSGRRSAVIRAIDAKTGDIQWQSSRHAFGVGIIGDSPDHYIAGINGSQVILVGERHCRSLDLKSGDQNWAIEVSRTSGRAECRGGRCLIPLCDGGIMTIDLSTGRRIHSGQSILPYETGLQFGAVTSDADILCTSTPVSVVVFPRVDAEIRQFRQSAAAEHLSAERILEQTQSHLINGDLPSAFELLRTSVAATRAAGDRVAIAKQENALGELILREWGAAIAEQWESPTNGLPTAIAGIPAGERPGPVSDVTVANSARILEHTELLADLELTTEQELRAAVFSVLSSESQQRLPADVTAELTLFKEWTKPIPVTDVWSVRPDILLERSTSVAAAPIIDESTASTWQLQKLAAASVLFPDLIQTATQRQRLAELLIRRGEHSAAELCLLSWRQSASVEAQDIAGLNELLQRLRSQDLIAGYAPEHARRRARPEDVSVSDGGVPGLSSKTTEPLIVDVTPYLRLPPSELQAQEKGVKPYLRLSSGELQASEHGTLLGSVPTWAELKFYFVESPAGNHDLMTFDPLDGTIRDRLPVPMLLSPGAAGFRSLEKGSSAPGIVPIIGAEQIAMLSCAVPGQAQILWRRAFRRFEQFDSDIEFGPLGADHFVWQFADRLHCSHPLTGEELWTRRLTVSRGGFRTHAVRRIFGDQHATVVLGSDNSSVQRFSTRDGHGIGSGRLAIEKGSETATTGRFLLYRDMNSRLHVFDGATSGDVLEDEIPVMLATYEPNIQGRREPDRLFSVLSEGRVVTLSSAREIVLIDTLAGNVAFRVPTTGYLNSESAIGVNAFERNGKLLVGLDDAEQNSGRNAERLTRSGEPSLGFGPLLCLDAQTGAVEWSLHLDQAVIPTVSGDPTDLLVAWNLSRPLSGTRLDETGNVLDVQLIDGTTGRVVAKASALATAPPFRCVHVAAENAIQIFSRDGVISFRTQADDEVAR